MPLPSGQESGKSFNRNAMQEPLKKEAISQEIFDLYDYYVHNKMERREFLDRLGQYAVGGLTVGALLQGNYSLVIADFTAALRIDPNYARCLLRRAQVPM